MSNTGASSEGEVEAVVEQGVLEIMGDADSGLELRDKLNERLETALQETARAIHEGGPIEGRWTASAADDLKQLDLRDQPSYTVPRAPETAMRKSHLTPHTSPLTRGYSD